MANNFLLFTVYIIQVTYIDVAAQEMDRRKYIEQWLLIRSFLDNGSFKLPLYHLFSFRSDNIF